MASRIGQLFVIGSMLTEIASAATAGGAANPSNLRCEGLVNPSGLDRTPPALSWNITSSMRGERQTAYEIMVASTPEGLAGNKGDLWDSGTVSSDQTLYIPYGGGGLASLQQCYWKVRIWDREGNPSAWSQPSQWTMGLLAATDWKGQWITASRWFMPPNLRPSGFITSPAATEDSPAWAQVDLGSPMPIASVKLYPDQAPRFPLRFRIEADDGLDFDNPKVIADCSSEDFKPGQTGAPVEFPGKGIIARRVRLLILKSPPVPANPAKAQPQKFQSMVRQMEVWSGGKNVALMRPTLESGHQWQTGHAAFLVDGMPSAEDGAECPANACPTTAAPLLRKAFQIDQRVKRATLCYAVLGMADVSINGTKVGNAVLDPPFTDYTKRIIYRTHDVTALLRTGENVLGATLGNGFFSTPARGFGERQNGNGQPRFLAQLDLDLADGTHRAIVTDSSWKWTTGEITFNDVWRGYTEDRRLAKPGWDRPGYADAQWRAVAIGKPLGGKLCATEGPPVRVLGALKPARVEGNTAFFDVLTSGWPRLTVNGKAGQVIEIRGDCGMEPQRYTLAADGPAVLEPRFVYFSGPHKLEITGLNEPLTVDAVSIQEVHADFEFTGGFHCSNAYLNQIYDALLRTHVNYNLEHPLDPMREKQGWTQDVETMFDSAAYMTDVSGLYRKWWQDMADNQSPDGFLGSVVPLVGRQVDDWNCPWWSGMIVWLPMEHYLYYGDTRMLAEAYQPMKRYVEYLDHIASIGAGTRSLDYPDPHYFLNTEAASHRLLIWNGANDWQNPYKIPPSPLLNMTAWYYYADSVSKTAAMLGNSADAARFSAMAEDVRRRTNAAYLDLGTGLYLGGSNNQTAQVMPLALGLVPEEMRPLTFQRLLEAIHSREDHVGTGFVGLPYLLQTLTNNYQAGLANRIVNQQDFPSWKQLMHDGVLAEAWNGGGAQMPSCGGSIGMWLYQSVLGIRPDPAAPGFKHFIVAPQPDPATGLTEAEGWYDSVQGRIVSNWKIANGTLRMDVTIPANTVATIRIPTNRPDQVQEGSGPVTHADGVKVVESKPGALVVEVGGGEYHFSATYVAIEL
jgi:alpha-L-rhamnosidase